MTNTIPVFDRGADPAAVARAISDSGLAVLSQLVDDATIDSVLAELRPYADAAEFGQSDFEGAKTRRTGAVPARSPTFRDQLAMHPVIMYCGDTVLGAAPWKLSSTELIEVYPNQPTQALHRDQWKYNYFDFPAGFETDLAGMWAMTDFTSDNGATLVIPGSHKLANNLRPDVSEGTPAEMPKGSLLLYTGSLYHGAGQNTADEVRIGLSVQHSLGWLQSGEYFHLDCPPDQVRGWPDSFLRFIGYRTFGDSLGVYRDSEDPLAAVYPEREFSRGWIVTNEGEKLGDAEELP